MIEHGIKLQVAKKKKEKLLCPDSNRAGFLIVQ